MYGRKAFRLNEKLWLWYDCISKLVGLVVPTSFWEDKMNLNIIMKFKNVKKGQRFTLGRNSDVIYTKCNEIVSSNQTRNCHTMDHGRPHWWWVDPKRKVFCQLP